MARGAAQGGDRKYAEALLNRSANIHYVAMGAALGGHREYAEALLTRGADINSVALGAAQGGHREYAEALLTRDATINDVAFGTALGGQVLKNNSTNQIHYLSFFKPDLIPKLVKAFKNLDDPIKIDSATEKRSIAMSKHMHTDNASYASALTITEPKRDKEYKTDVKNDTSDEFYETIGFWSKELTGDALQSETKSSSESTYGIQ